MDVLRILMEDCNVDFTYAAVSFGHLDILKYLHENGCPWNEKSFELASLNGNLKCLQYLHENGVLGMENVVNYSIFFRELLLNKVSDYKGQKQSLIPCMGTLSDINKYFYFYTITL